MPRNYGKGGKKRRKGKGTGAFAKRELAFKDEGQEYAQVLKMHGGGRLEAYCFDGIKRLCHIRGKILKKEWINPGDYVLISLRDFEDKKADVLQRYNEEEARALKAYGELPESAKINEVGEVVDSEDDDNIEFEYGDEEIKQDDEELKIDKI